MADKPRETKIGNASIKAEISEDGLDVFIRLKFDQPITSYTQINHILSKFFSLADFKYLEKDQETSIH